MKIKNISLIVLFLLAFFCFFSKKEIYASENNQNGAILKNLQAKIGPDFQYSLDRNTGKATFIANKNNRLPLNLAGINKTDAVSVSNRFMREYGSFFGIADAEKETSLFKKDVDSLGMANVRYGQKYKDVPVFGGQIIVHLGKDKNVNSANGKIIPNISIDTDSKISKDQAEDIAKNLWEEQKRPDDPETLANKLYIFNKSLFQSQPDDAKNYLVWRVDLYKDKPVSHEYYFIDAQNGDLVFQITGMQDVVYRHIWDCSLGFVWGTYDCYLDIPYSGYTYGRSEGQPVRGPYPYPVPYSGLSDTDNLYDRTGNNYDYYSEKFSRNGANNNGGMGDGTPTYPIDTTVGVTFINSYLLFPDYEGSRCPNSWFDGSKSIHFCQGETTHDIVGHEYAHAVNYFSVLDGGDPAGLTYSGEPGALNEGNSDVFGTALEDYSEGGAGDWLFGEDSLEGASRDMSMPSNYIYNVEGEDVPYPNKFHDSNYYCGTEDHNGVHLNSSVPNHAAYLMAIGGTYNGCAITGIGREKEEAIFYEAQTAYYIPSTDFNGAYDNLISACGDLYGGTDSPDCKNVKKALQSVEMNQPGFCGGEPETTPECATTVATPVASPAGGTYSSEQSVTLSTTTGGASIYYTIDGTEPDTSSILYAGAITVSTGQTIKAIAVKSVMINSGVMSESYILKVATPVASPAGGTFSSEQNVTLSTTTSGADIYYTTDDSAPTTGSTHYTEAINVSSSETLKAIAIKSGMGDSDVMSENYTMFNTSKASIFSNGQWYLDLNGNGTWNGASTDTYVADFGKGLTGAIPITGDWNGDGLSKIGVFYNGSWYLDLNGNGAWNGASTDTYVADFGKGVAGAIPVTGDWNGDGKTEIGIFVPSTGQWYLDYNSNGAWNGASVDKYIANFGKGLPDVQPVTGNWSGDLSNDAIGVYSNGSWYLDNNDNGIWNGASTDVYYTNFGKGLTGAIPVTGHWSGGTSTGIGIFAPTTGQWYLDLNNHGVWDGASTDVYYADFGKGLSNAKAISGKW